MNTQNQIYLDAIIQFAQSIDLDCRIDNVNLTGREFVPYVSILKGSVVFDYNLARASDLIHELAHVALIPKSHRIHMDNNIFHGLNKFINESFDSGNMELIRIASACEDGEATAWSWAAGKHLNIPDELIIEDDQYSGKGEDLRLMLSLGSYAGISSLRQAKYTNKRNIQFDHPPETIYPNMLHWTADQALQALKIM